MARTTKPKRRINRKQFLLYLDKVGEFVFPLGVGKSAGYRAMRKGLPDIDDYFPFSFGLTANQLERTGMVIKKDTKDGLSITITDKGRQKILKYDLESLKPIQDKWDKKWRLVFFDIPKISNRKRDKFRKYLKQIGMEQFQESVFISPYDVFDQVQYLREVMDIPNTIKLARLDFVENEEELKEIFDLK